MSSKQQGLEQINTEIQKALSLITTEEADEIIGSPPPDEYKPIIQGVQAIMGLHWVAMRRHGLRQTKRSLDLAAKSMTMMLNLTHYVYALGIRQGRDGAQP